jgi:hypothetical protein
MRAENLWGAMAQARRRVKVRRQQDRRYFRESDAARPNAGRRWLRVQAATNRPRKHRVVVVVVKVRSCVIARACSNSRAKSHPARATEVM